MRKLINEISWILLCAMIVAVMPAIAETYDAEDAPIGWYDSPFSMLYGVGRRTLTSTENFTAAGTADFYLDGMLFKHAGGIYAQEDENSYQSISLKTPREDGTYRKNGYSVVDYGGIGYAIERYRDKSHLNVISNVPKSYPLRLSVQTETLLDLGEQIAAYLDVLGKDDVQISSDAEDMRHIFHLDSTHFPALVQTGLNIFWQAAIQRYFLIAYNDMPLEEDARFEDYSTVTQGIIFNTRSLQLQRLVLDASFNESDELLFLSGEAWMEIHGRNEENNMLRIVLTLEGKDYGTTSINTVIPEEDRNPAFMTNTFSTEDIAVYFNTAAARGISWQSLGLTEITYPVDHLNHRVISTFSDAEKYALEIAALDALGFEDGALLIWDISKEEETQHYTAQGYYPDDSTESGPALTLVFDKTGFVWTIRNESSGYQNADILDFEEFDSDEYTAWRSEIGLMLWVFQENLNPGSTMIYAETLRESEEHGVGYASYHQTRELGENQYVVMYGTLHQHYQEKVRYVVQTAPVFRVVEIDASIDADEGGNG